MLIETVLANREKTHGLYSEQAKFSQMLKRLFRETQNWGKLDDCQAQSLELICDKVSRILKGNPNEADHWQDISGYASLVLRELETSAGGSSNPEVPYAKLPVSIKSQEGDTALNVPSFLVRQMEDDFKEAIKK